MPSRKTSSSSSGPTTTSINKPMASVFISPNNSPVPPSERPNDDKAVDRPKAYPGAGRQFLCRVEWPAPNAFGRPQHGGIKHCRYGHAHGKLVGGGFDHFVGVGRSDFAPHQSNGRGHYLADDKSEKYDEGFEHCFRRLRVCSASRPICWARLSRLSNCRSSRRRSTRCRVRCCP